MPEFPDAEMKHEDAVDCGDPPVEGPRMDDMHVDVVNMVTKVPKDDLKALAETVNAITRDILSAGSQLGADPRE